MSTALSGAAPQARPAVRQLAGSLIREVANAGMGRTDVLPFWFGESDRPTAPYIHQAAQQSLAQGETFYAQNLGRPYLREAIAVYLSALHGRPLGPERVVSVPSGMAGLLMAYELLLSPGDRVVAVTPLWPNLVEAPRLFGASVARVSLVVQDGRWSLDLQRLLDALTPDTRLLVLNSPNNPTGWTIDAASLQAVQAHCRRHGIWILSDDVYERLVYDPTQASAPSLLRTADPQDRLISVNSFSKAWCMTGWRAGWMVLPASLVDDAGKVAEYNFSCQFEPVQRAATAALQQGEADVARLRESLSHSRQLLSTALAALPGVEVPEAGGAMYVFFRLAGHGDSLALAKQLVQQVGLGLAPGAAFGAEGEGWLRWCHAVSDDHKLREGVQRLRRFLGV
ncbi:pyridoxal phosphate-dependent aminotransferase [Ideonella livida]|uniref:Pyridoxal phosphate-dependent aminotransferase n=1 Tax=Ideonella livida TaxID=2707176 RepID=A0A7C9TKW8_9BURK|nr:pyridoxal phosphate-dependent aminotransferase [Ideonella livida]NDY93119.1 pyridoxal phosphate-dependent aminotransferase [Ideonella livida]